MEKTTFWICNVKGWKYLKNKFAWIRTHTQTHQYMLLCKCMLYEYVIWPLQIKIPESAPTGESDHHPLKKKKKKKVKAVSLWLLDESPLLSSSSNSKRQCYKEYRDNKTLFGSPFTHISVLISYILFPYFFLTHFLSCLATKLGLVFSLKKQL